MSITGEKQRLRAFYNSARKKIPANEVEKLSARVARNILSLPRLLESELILAYHSIGAEVDTAALIDMILETGRAVVLPYIREDGLMGVGRIFNRREDLEQGPFGTMVPIERLRGNVYTEHIGAIVCPGVAFDGHGVRLGRGGGHYDKFLRTMAGKAFIVGCGFDCQISDTPLPKEDHDVAMDAVITEIRAFPFGICPAIKTQDDEEDERNAVDEYIRNNKSAATS